MVIIMTKIYFVRHCEAMGNLDRIFQGVTDTDISELGQKQLECLKTRFADIKLDKIYSSPLKRAYKTALAVKGDKKVCIEKVKGLIELNGGSVEGKKFADTFKAFPDLADAWDNHPEDFAPKGGERMASGYERIWNTFRYIAKISKGQTVACTSHGGIIRCLLCRLIHNDIHQLKNVGWSENTAVSLFEVDDNMNVTVSFINDVSHLPKELLPERSRLSGVLTGAIK